MPPDRLPATDPYRRYRTVGGALACCIAVAICAEWFTNGIHPTSRDFISFWGAAKLALAGTPALAYDPAALHAVQAQVAAFDTGEMPFPYTPAFLLLVLPFGTLPFPVAMILWSVLTGGLYALVAARWFAPRSGWLALAFPPVFAVAAIGQNGFVTAALFLGGLALYQRGHGIRAGLMLGCLVVKPQLALMLPVAMLAAREGRVIVAATLSAAGVLLLGLVAFGPAAFSAWLQEMPLYMHIARDGLVGWHKLVSVYAAGRQAGLGEQAALALHGGVALVAATLVARCWFRETDPMTRAATLGAATMLASPYVYLYDALILLPAYVCLVQRRAPVPLVAFLWLLPLAIIAQTALGAGSVSIGPLLPIVLLAGCRWPEPVPDALGTPPAPLSSGARVRERPSTATD